MQHAAQSSQSGEVVIRQLSSKPLLIEEKGGLNLAQNAFLHNIFPVSHMIQGCVIKGHPVPLCVHKGMVVRTIVAHHAVQAVLLAAQRLVDLPNVHLLQSAPHVCYKQPHGLQGIPRTASKKNVCQCLV